MLAGVGSTKYSTGTSGMGYRGELMFLGHVSYARVLEGVHLQVDCDTLGSQIIDSQDAADDISAEVVKDQDLPRRISILVEQKGRVLAISSGLAILFRRFVIQAQDAFDGS